METKHTPGPWVVDTTVALGPYNILTLSEEIPQDCCIVCSFSADRRKPSVTADRPRLEADARLISKAPELLAFARRVAWEPIGAAEASPTEILVTLEAEARALLKEIDRPA